MLDDDAKREPFICDLEPLGIMIKSALQVVYGGGGQCGLAIRSTLQSMLMVVAW